MSVCYSRGQGVVMKCLVLPVKRSKYKIYCNARQIKTTEIAHSISQNHQLFGIYASWLYNRIEKSTTQLSLFLYRCCTACHNIHQTYKRETLTCRCSLKTMLGIRAQQLLVTYQLANVLMPIYCYKLTAADIIIGQAVIQRNHLDYGRNQSYWAFTIKLE